MTRCEVVGCSRASERRGMCEAHYARFMRNGSAGSAKIKTRPGALKEWLLANVGCDQADCLPWPFGTLENGYGSLILKGSRTTAHREMCRLAHGEPPAANLDAAHSCGVRACCNPRHLRWATRTSNANDRIAHGTASRGAGCYRTTISQHQVLEIVELLKTEKPAAIAKRMGVSRSTIKSIAYGCSWSWLTGIRKAKSLEIRRAA